MNEKIFLKRLLSPRISNGHPWIYDNEIEKVEGEPAIGSIVDVFTFAREFIGRGYYNQHSKIRVRLLTRSYETIDRGFFEKRINDAIEYRSRYFHKADTPENVYRFIYGEADGLSGLIVDRFDDVFVFQFNTSGMQRFRSDLLRIFRDRFPDSYFFDKTDASSLVKEGIEPLSGSINEWIGKSKADPLVVRYQNLDFSIHLAQAQKTGIYLDQLDNSILAASMCFPKGKEVWDIFSNTGNFGLRMLQQGAKHAVFVDQSEDALEDCRENLRLNGLSHPEGSSSDAVTVIAGNAFDILREWEDHSKKADIIILDPPSFTKSRSSKGNALRGYKEVNLRALKSLRVGGFLVTSSCSQAVSRQEFEMMMYSAASDVGASLRLIYRGGQPYHHPILWSIFETDYLKFYIFERIR